MALRLVEFSEGEWYHCYSRTIDNSRPLEDTAEVERFLETLYLANSADAMPNIPQLHSTKTHTDIFSISCRQPLVSIGCYCIMPTHYHLLLQPITENGVSDFMQKMGTGFTRFYNEKHDRVGNLFIKPFRSKHINDDAYMDRVVQYIHLNAVELFEPQWKQGIIRDLSSLKKKLHDYEYSSLWEHEGKKRPQSAILNLDAISLVRDNTVYMTQMIAEAVEYYQFLELDM